MYSLKDVLILCENEGLCLFLQGEALNMTSSQMIFFLFIGLFVGQDLDILGKLSVK
jgi:hypothetical protein